jgi:putative glutamine amidotransferase
MRKNLMISLLLVAFSFLLCCTETSEQQIDSRYFDSADQDPDKIILTILYPSLGSIRSLMNLKKEGIFPLENTMVIGVFHEMERTDYQRSLDLVEEKGIEWLKFHKLKGDINRKGLFQENSLTEEFKTIFIRSDGIIFFGGADIPPFVYGEKTHLLSRVTTPNRHYMESSFVFHLLGGLQDTHFEALLESFPQFPILGICLGCQTLNVGTGGSLIQDVWQELYEISYLEDATLLPKENWHSNPYARLYPEDGLFPYYMHPIQFNGEGKFVSEFGFNTSDTPYILSIHHQAAARLGKGIKVNATSLDGKVVEAIEHKDYPNVLGVQFHPEFPILYDKTKQYKLAPHDPETLNIFTLLESNNPSLTFHKKIWSWFEERIKSFHSQRK